MFKQLRIVTLLVLCWNWGFALVCAANAPSQALSAGYTVLQYCNMLFSDNNMAGSGDDIGYKPPRGTSATIYHDRDARNISCTT
jgi:hypothetical protein